MAVSKQVLTRKIHEEEDDRQYPYKCSKKKWTIGKGINLQTNSMPHDVMSLWDEECPELKVRRVSGIMQGLFINEFGLPQSVRDLWFEGLLDRLINQVADRLHDEYDVSYGDLPEDAQIVLIDCSYQMGLDGFFAFKKTLKFIKRRDYVDAAIEILDSKYFRDDTPERAQRNSDLLMGCGCKL